MIDSKGMIIAKDPTDENYPLGWRWPSPEGPKSGGFKTGA